ncbi:unnamed protein product [Callosobruchus maculatus]|uniref:Uncharacterized protein n=1 Tax=Callosobruchus maculatus TaxID=64391 RepID=A0A653BSZ2_CALMS|nr:unnamed protein product [Callosobruchus maculatus]
MSQLNPNAAEFVPVSPATSPTGGPTVRLLEDDIIAQSPKRPMNMDKVVDAKQFEEEVRSRPSELDDSFCSNGHAENEHNLSSDMMENLLNGKNIDEIPEFQPGSTPTKSRPDEFHFGPNAAPFTPKHLDQSEALSTKAVFGDDTAQNIDLSLNTSADRSSPIKSPIKKESDDPMSMSFYADRDDANPFDLNKVQMLPDNLDDFLQQPDNNVTANLPAEQKSENLIMNNDDALQTTDLDKHNYDDEKELASPLEPEKELSCPDFREDGITPEPTNENLLGGDFCQLSQKMKTPEPLPRDVELISPDSAHESKSPTEESRPESIPSDVELLSPQPKIEEQLHQTATEVNDLLGGFGSHEQEDLLCERPTSCERPMSESPACERPESKSPMVCERPESKSPMVCERPESKSPMVCERPMSCERPTSESPLCEMPESRSPMLCERPESKSPMACERPESKSPAFGEQVVVEQNAFGDNPFVGETRKEEVNMFEVEPEEQMPKEEESEPPLDEEEIKATIVVGPQGVIEIEEEPSEYIPSPAAEPIDLEPQVIEPVQDVCPLEKPIENAEVFEYGDADVTKETIAEKPVGEVEVRMENISPQFAEQAFVMTPSEESRQEEVPAAPLAEEAAKEPLPTAPAPASEDGPAEAALVAAGVAAAATAAVATAAAAAAAPTTPTPAPKPAEDKKKTTPAAAKRPSVGAKTNATPSPKGGAAKPSVGAAKPKTASSAAPKASPTKTATMQKSPAPTAAPKPAAASKLMAPKPRTAPPNKTTDKKPLANGDVKQPPIRSTLTTRKSVTETAATKTTARPATASARPATSAATKTTTAAPKPAPRPATAPKAAAPRTNGTTTASAARLKPTPKSPVASKAPSTTTKTATNLTSKTTTSAARPAFTTNTKPKAPATTAPAPPKPRVPLSRRPAVETDKQNKEAVNKATAGRTSAPRTGVTALKKVESKTATTTRTTVMKSTTTTMKSAAMTKKPAEIVRNKSTKTTTHTTKVDKPEMNGVATEAPEAVKAPTNEVLLTDCEPQLVKDNSPAIDNKTIENSLIQTNAAD